MPTHLWGLIYAYYLVLPDARPVVGNPLPGLTTTTVVVARQERFPCLEDTGPGFPDHRVLALARPRALAGHQFMVYPQQRSPAPRFAPWLPQVAARSQETILRRWQASDLQILRICNYNNSSEDHCSSPTSWWPVSFLWSLAPLNLSLWISL